MTYIDGSRYLDGPRLAKWMRAELDGRHLTPSLCRRLHNWASGARVDFYTADHYLVEYDLSPCDIPDECWDVEQTRRRGSRAA